MTMPRPFWGEPEHQARLAAVVETATRDGVVTLTLTPDEAAKLRLVATTGYRELRAGAPQEARDTVLVVLNLLDIGLDVLQGQGAAESKQDSLGGSR